MEDQATAVSEAGLPAEGPCVPEKTPHLHRKRDRRLQCVALRLPERRTGFDRRCEYPVTGGFRDRPGTLLGVLITVNVLSLIDFAFTWVQLSAGVSSEGNPALAMLFANSPFAAWIFKTGIVVAVSFGIWHARRYRAILLVAALALVTYGAVFIYHLMGMRQVGLI